MRLGIKMVLDLTYTILLPGVFRKPKNSNQFNFWAHSLGVVYLTRSLAHFDELEILIENMKERLDAAKSILIRKLSKYYALISRNKNFKDTAV